MNFTVIWTPEAEHELTELWLRASSRQLVASAADQIDVLLRRDPEMIGESRDEHIRILFVSPLVAEYEVLEADRIVYVRAVWQPSARKS